MPKTRKMLSDKKAPYIQSLLRLIETQSKETLANWAIDYCETVMQPLWERDYPDDLRPQKALRAARMTRGRFVCHNDKNMLYCKK